MFHLRGLALLVGALLPSVLAAPAPAVSEAEAVPGKYIVALKDGDSSILNSHLAWVGSIHSESSARRATAGVEKTYSIANFHAYAGEFDEGTIEKIKASPDVAHVSPDYIMHLADSVPVKRTWISQVDADWNLRSISHHNPWGSAYDYDDSAGAGTWAYVVDSGVLTTHTEFEGRADPGYNAAGGQNIDTLGHGTHVAGTIAGKTYGVAKKAKIVSVKVFNGTSASFSVILDGFNWAAKDIVAKQRRGHAVINLSLGGPNNPIWTEAIDAALNKQGILTIVAAGNGDPETGLGLPVSGSSPANAASAITVGAVDEKWRVASFSNYGAGVDILAPGVDIQSAFIGSNSATNTLDGTSMATPHVTGVALFIISYYNILNPVSLTNQILGLATRNKILGALNGSPNALVFNGNLAAAAEVV